MGCNGQSFADKQKHIMNIPAYSSTDQETIFTIEDSSIFGKKAISNFYYHDSLWIGTPFVINKKVTKLIISRPTLICQANQNQTFYLVYPGEHLKIKIIKNNEIIFTVDSNKQRNNELIFFKKLVDNYGRLYNFFPNKTYTSKVENIWSIKKSEIFINDLKRLRINFLDSFAKTSSISSDFSKLALNTIESAAFKDSLMLYWSNKELLIGENLYNNFIDQKMETIKNIEFQPYPVYQDAVLSLLSIRTTPYLSYEPKSQSDFINRFNAIEKEFDGILKEFLLANTIVSSRNLGITIPPDYIKRFEQQSRDKFYRVAVIESLNSNKKVIPVLDFDKLMSADGNTTVNIKDLISKNKGKVVVFDFWASWCLPCREEFPASKRLKSYFNKDDVVFIYLSEDKDIGKWKKGIQEEDLDTDENFVFLDADKSTFRKKFNITTIPRYIVLNKDGLVVNSDAPRPSDPQLFVIIKKYLKK